MPSESMEPVEVETEGCSEAWTEDSVMVQEILVWMVPSMTYRREMPVSQMRDLVTAWRSTPFCLAMASVGTKLVMSGNLEEESKKRKAEERQ